MSEERQSTGPLRNAELSKLFRCARCGLSYSPSKSTSSLRLTYCSFFCELGDLGFSMSGLEHMEVRRHREEPNEGLRPPIGVRD